MPDDHAPERPTSPGYDPGLTQPLSAASPTQAMPAPPGPPAYGQPGSPQPYGQQPANDGQPQPYGRPGPPQPYAGPPRGGDVRPAAYGQPMAPWQPAPKAEVPFGPAAKWTVWINLGIAALLAVGVYLLAALLINLFGQLSDSSSSSSSTGDQARDNMWLWALLPAGLTFVASAVWGVLTSLLCLALLRLSAGFRAIGAGGQGVLAWLIAIVVSSVVGGLGSFVLSFSGEGITQIFNR